MDAVQIHNIVPTEDKGGLKSNGLMLGQGMGLKERLLLPIMIIRGEIEMTQTIEQLQAKVDELTVEIAKMLDSNPLDRPAAQKIRSGAWKEFK